MTAGPRDTGNTEAGWDVEPKVPPTVIAAGPIEDVTVIYAQENDARPEMIVNALHKLGIKATSQYTILGPNLLSDLEVQVGKME